MRVLVTGGSGVIGVGLISALLERGHHVRLLARGAEGAAREWPDEVESFAADVTDPEVLNGAAEDCDAVVHISGIVTEKPPAVTFERVNVEGTRNILAEAERAGSPRFVFVSSLGADRGASAYHTSKQRAEELVREYAGSWVIVRPGGVYGPGDDVMSVLLQMHRTLPAVPVIGFGDQPFQPIFYADAGEALAIAVERDDLSGAYEIAGDERTTPSEILEKFTQLTGRRPVSLHVPEPLIAFTASAAESAGVPFPLDRAKFRMLIEGNVIEPESKNALTAVFGVTPTPLDEGLAFLVDAQPEQTPGDGVGALERKRFRADIVDAAVNAEELMVLVRERCTDLMDVEFDAEPGASQEIIEGATLTAALPLRGNIQVRVEEVTPARFTFATLRGHPLSGIVRFEAEDVDENIVRFSITVCARSATLFDWFAMNTLGRLMQAQNWISVVRGVVALSGGASDGVDVHTEVCDESTAEQIESEIAQLVARRKREDRIR